MENTKPKEILENIINVMEKTNVDEWEIDKLTVVLNYINELEKENEVLKKPIVENWENARTIKINNPLQQRIDKAIELIEKYLNREYVITDEYFEHIIQILRGEE